METKVKWVTGFALALIGVMSVAGFVTGFSWIGYLCLVLCGMVTLGAVLDVKVGVENESLTVEYHTPATKLAQVRRERAVAEPVLDFSHKQARREAEDAEWTRMWMDALGPERAAVLVEEWGKGSRRLALAQRLREDEAWLRGRGRVVDAEIVLDLRRRVCERPEVRLATQALDYVEKRRAEVLNRI